jgi:hypothetical protein
MHRLLPLLASGSLLILGSCATRTEFRPEGGPVTVGMPAELSERERGYVGEVETALRGAGYLPVRHGAGELELEFRISEGPINADTTLELRDGGTVLAQGEGRGSGVPMIGRDKVTERSFRKAFDDFQAVLPAAGAAPTAPADGGEMEYVY